MDDRFTIGEFTLYWDFFGVCSSVCLVLITREINSYEACKRFVVCHSTNINNLFTIIALIVESMGMSRAAQKKRKHQKLLISAADQADDNTSSHHGIMKKSKQLGTFDIWSKTLLPPIWMNDTVVDIPTIDFVSVIKLRDAIDITADQRAAVLFSKMTYPVTRSSFYTTYWNKLPLHVERNDNQYFKEVITKKSLSTILNGQLLLESVDVLVAKYNDEWDSEHQTYKSKFDWKSQSNQSLEHQSFNKSDFEDVQKRGFVVSFLCPQKYNDRIWKLISLMEPEFNCRIEANVVLCPANATGCSYRYHGFDQFICQLEGTSIWTLFRPPTEKELPRGLICEVNPLEYLATNGSSDVKAYREVSLKAGDFLYIPKGWVLKQENREPLACTYLCLNTNFDNSMADLFEILVPHTLADILADTISLRRSLPANSFSYLGIAHSEVENSESRLAFQFECNKALQLFADRALDLVDPAVDQVSHEVSSYLFRCFII